MLQNQKQQMHLFACTILVYFAVFSGCLSSDNANVNQVNQEESPALEISVSQSSRIENLRAEASGSSLHVSFSALENSAKIQRSDGSVDFRDLATLSQGQTSYTDQSVSAGRLYLYRLVDASNRVISNWNYKSAPGNFNLPPAAPYKELQVAGDSTSETIQVGEKDDDLVVWRNDVEKSHGPANQWQQIVVHGGGGNDTIELLSSLQRSARVYGDAGDDSLRDQSPAYAILFAVGEGRDTLQGDGQSTSYWADPASTDTVLASQSERDAHRVHTVSLSPATADQKTLKKFDLTPSKSILWGGGATLFDVEQGFVQNCQTTAAMQGWAQQRPELVREVAVEKKPGSYLVALGDFASPQHVEVDNKIASFYFSKQPPSGRIWWPIIEKAEELFKNPALKSRQVDGFQWSEATAETAYQKLRQAIDDGRVAISYSTSAPALEVAVIAQGHAHTVVQTFRAPDGTPRFIVRNPYGTTSLTAPSYHSQQQGLLTMTFSEFAANFHEVRIYAL